MKSSPIATPGSRILIVEDELPMRRALEDCLSGQGYRVLSASNGEEGLTRAMREKPDLILLDVMMPGLSGFDLCAALRKAGCSIPILMLTAKGEIEDRVRGLDEGADDYLIKPFSTSELLARMRSILRRKQLSSRSAEFVLGDCRIDLQRMEATQKGRPLELSVREYGILRLLFEADGAPVSREQFLDKVWGVTSFPSTRTVDTHILQLRKKIEQVPETPRWILTVHGLGYRLWLGE